MVFEEELVGFSGVKGGLMEGEKEGSLQTDKSVVTGEESRQFFGSELLGLVI